MSGREQSDPESAIVTPHEAMDLWRGPVLDGTPESSSLQADRARLELLFDEPVTELIEAYLDSGQPDRAPLALRESVDQNPVDERRWAQLMIALGRDLLPSQRASWSAHVSRAQAELP